jgi:hypothetical protein
VERALTLIANGTLTVAVARASRGKTVILPRSFNNFTGRESTRDTAFNDAMWGKATRFYMKSACKIPQDKFNLIIERAQEYKPNRARKTNEVVEVIESDDDDERACIVISDGDDDYHCKFSPFFATSLTYLFRI